VETIIIKGSNKGDRKVEIKEKLIEKISGFVSSGVPLSDITVLTRTNEQIKFVFSSLWEAGIPAVTEHSLRIEKSPTIKAVVNFLKFIHDPKDESSLVGFLQSDLARGLNDVECFDESWIFEAHDKNLSLFKYIREFHQDVYNSVFAPFIERAGYETAYDLARWVIRRFDVRRRFPEESSFVLRFLELINNLEEKLGRFVSLSEFISLWEKEVAEEQLGIPESIGAQLLVSSESDVENNKGAVRIMTIHGAKGLEFPVVILPFLDWDSKNPEVIVLEDGRLARVSKPYPEEVRNAVLKKKKEELIESFNLLYVAFTRARNHLVVMIPGEKSPPIAHFLCNFLGLLS
jgi:ATP-dependent exoDNAse (exonuclease V) beta subunit